MNDLGWYVFGGVLILQAAFAVGVAGATLFQGLIVIPWKLITRAYGEGPGDFDP